MLLTKGEILAAEDLPHEDVDVPEWGGTVRVCTMTAGDRDDYESEIYETDGTNVKVKREMFRAKLLAKCLKDENGERIFSTPADVILLATKSAKPVQRLFEVAQRLNGLGAEAAEDIEKN